MCVDLAICGEIQYNVSVYFYPGGHGYSLRKKQDGRDQEMEWLAQLMQTWGAFIQTIRFTDILDVAVIAYLVYRLML